MTLEQIISLTQAGFTKDDIYAMIDSNTNPNHPQPPTAAPTPAPTVVTPTPAPVQAMVPQQVQAPTPAPTPTPTPTPAPAWGFAPAPVPEQNPQQVPQQVPQRVPQQVPQQVPTWGAQGVIQPMSENEKMINRLMESMNNLNSTMQKSNLMADVQPKAATTEDMLAAIINPPEK